MEQLEKVGVGREWFCQISITSRDVAVIIIISLFSFQLVKVTITTVTLYEKVSVDGEWLCQISITSRAVAIIIISLLS